MNFLERNGANLRPGNVVFTMILLTGVLGMCAYLYTTFLGVYDHVDFINVNSSNSSLKGTNYSVLASLVTAIVTSGVCLGIMIGKSNNEFMGASRAFETVALFILVLVVIVMACLTTLPRDDASSDINAHNEIIYEAVILSVVSIVLGMITVMSGMNKEYSILGTSLFLLMAIVTLGLTVYIYTLSTDNENIDTTGTDTDKLERSLTDNEKSVLIATFSLAAVVVAAGVLHMLLERKGFRKLMGRKASPRRSPGRKSSPKRKLGTLKPRK